MNCKLQTRPQDRGRVTFSNLQFAVFHEKRDAKVSIVKWEIFRWHAYLNERHVNVPWWFTLCTFVAFCLSSLPSQPPLGSSKVLHSVEFSFFILFRDQFRRCRWEVEWLTQRTVVMFVLLICILRTFTHCPDKYCRSAS